MLIEWYNIELIFLFNNLFDVVLVINFKGVVDMVNYVVVVLFNCEEFSMIG